MIKEELNFQDPQFETTMIPGRFVRWFRQCVIIQFVRMILFSLRSIGIVWITRRNERDVAP